MAVSSEITGAPRAHAATSGRTVPGRAVTINDRLAYVAVRAVQAIVSRLPVQLALWLARRTGDLACLVMPRRRAVAAEALRTTFGLAPGDAQLARLTRQAFEHIVLVAVELVLVHRRWRRAGGLHARPAGLLPECGELCGLQRFREIKQRGCGAIVVTGHVGNWEVMGAIAASIGVPVSVVHRPLDNALIDRWLLALRTDFGTHLIEKQGAMKGLARALVRNENVVLLMDQHAGRGGLKLPFLGREASTFDTAARLARRFAAPIFGVFTYRLPEPLRFRMAIELVAEPDPTLDKEADVVRMTRLANDALSSAIRHHPDQWLWLHRRWRAERRPPAASE
ncbi:MAG: lysophospholipid acyltransferase family protein [Planctomycetota bacterium]